MGCGGLPRPSRGAGLSSTSGGLLGGSVLSEDQERCPAGLEPAARAGTCFSWAFWCPCVKWGPSEPVGSGAFPGDPAAASRAGLDCPWEWTAGALAGRESRAGASVVWGAPAGSGGASWPLLLPPPAPSLRRRLKAPCSRVPPAPRPRVSPSGRQPSYVSGRGGGRASRSSRRSCGQPEPQSCLGPIPTVRGHGAGGALRTAAPVAGVSGHSSLGSQPGLEPLCGAPGARDLSGTF